MFLHIGGDVVVAMRDVVAIIDAASMERGPLNAEFIKKRSGKPLLQKITNGPPNSWVITTSKAYASPISAATLRKRATSIRNSIDAICINGRERSTRVY